MLADGQEQSDSFMAAWDAREDIQEERGSEVMELSNRSSIG